MLNTRSRLPFRAHKQIWIIFTLMLTIFVFLTTANEVLDLPHHLFGDEPTTFSQRRGEVLLELSIYFIVLFSSYYYIRKKIRTQIKILEGFIPICANCKKIREDLDWKTLKNTSAQIRWRSLPIPYALTAYGFAIPNRLINYSRGKTTVSDRCSEPTSH